MQYKVVPYIQEESELNEYQERTIIRKYQYFKKMAETEERYKESLYAFEFALTIFGYDVEEVE